MNWKSIYKRKRIEVFRLGKTSSYVLRVEKRVFTTIYVTLPNRKITRKRAIQKAYKYLRWSKSDAIPILTTKQTTKGVVLKQRKHRP